MRYAVIFEDSPAMSAVRSISEPAHLAFLEANRAEILMAGGLKNEHGGSYVGGASVSSDAVSQQAPTNAT